MSTETTRRYDDVNQCIAQARKWASSGDDGWTPYREQVSCLADEVERLRTELGNAIDEIYALRALAAYDAAVTEQHMELKSFPKSRREVGDVQVQRLRGMARGEAVQMRGQYPGLRKESRRDLEQVAGKATLTTIEWLEEQR